MIGKSSCASVAPSAQNRSKVASTVPSGSQPSRSILLTTRIGRRPSASALRVTKRVCGIGPSKASTSRQTESTILQHALDLAAEVGVAGRVDDVDARPLPGDGGVLGEDGDAALALEVVRVHRAVGDHLAAAELPRLAQEAVDQRGLAVVDVGDDGDVADVWACCGHRGGRMSTRPGPPVQGFPLAPARVVTKSRGHGLKRILGVGLRGRSLVAVLGCGEADGGTAARGQPCGGRGGGGAGGSGGQRGTGRRREAAAVGRCAADRRGGTDPGGGTRRRCGRVAAAAEAGRGGAGGSGGHGWRGGRQAGRRRHDGRGGPGGRRARRAGDRRGGRHRRGDGRRRHDGRPERGAPAAAAPRAPAAGPSSGAACSE